MDEVKKPRIPVELKRLDQTFFDNLQSNESLELSAVNLSKTSLGILEHVTEIEIDSSKLSNVTFEMKKLDTFSFSDVLCDSCDFSNVKSERTSFDRVEIKNSKLLGFAASESFLKDATFSKCNISLAQLFSSKVVRVSFIDCDLSNSDFRDCELSACSFINCKLINTDFSKAEITKLVLTGSELDKTKITFDQLSGAVIDSVQAVQILNSVGITVE